MIEVKKGTKEDLAPVGSVWCMIEVTPQYALYDVYEGDNEFVEIWMPIKEYRKEINNG